MMILNLKKTFGLHSLLILFQRCEGYILHVGLPVIIQHLDHRTQQSTINMIRLYEYNI